MPLTTVPTSEATNVGLWHSDKLSYRSLEKEDAAFLLSLTQDEEAFVNWMGDLPLPPGTKPVSKIHDRFEQRLLAAVICLSTKPSADAEATNDPSTRGEVPIGVIVLGEAALLTMHHRCASVGISIRKEYQNQGFGTEAIKWALNWGFRYAGLHRIELAAFSYNEAAIRLYQRLGFKIEGCRREAHFTNGKHWDVVFLGVLEDEWRGAL